MESKPTQTFNYADAGVDIDAGNEVVQRIKSDVRSTFQPYVMADIGSFGSMINLKQILTDYDEPIMIQSIDGVGTKVTVASMTGNYAGLGKDIVNHCTDDILVHGAKPISFLDYVASQKLSPDVVASIVRGMSEACRESGISLVGGETAEMPPTYQPGEIDIAGCITGVVEKSELITGATIQPGDIALGLHSSGLHTNGYSLARKLILEVADLSLDSTPEGFEQNIGDTLLAPHVSYYPAFSAVRENGIAIQGMAHITGGGFWDNIPRTLPESLGVSIKLGSWPVQPIFELLQKIGNVSRDEMYRTFNMGIGMVWFIRPEMVEMGLNVIQQAGFGVSQIGAVTESDQPVELI